MRCLNCEFYNQPNAPYCLDCGETDFTNPALFGEAKEDYSEIVSLKFVFISTAVIVLAAVSITLMNDPEELRPNFFFALTFGLIASVLVSVVKISSKNFIARRDKRRREMASTNKITLNLAADEINYKLQLLTQENRELIDLFAPVYEDSEGDEAADKIEYVETDETDKRLFETVELQLALCQMQFCEINLIREKAEILYFLETLNNPVEPETVEDEETIEDLLQEFEYLWEEYNLDENNSYSDLYLSRQDVLFKKIDSAQKQCERVRDEIIEKRAARQRGLSYFPSQTILPSGEQIFGEYDVKRILSDYSSTFSELESEYKRLKSVSVRGDKFID